MRKVEKKQKEEISLKEASPEIREAVEYLEDNLRPKKYFEVSAVRLKRENQLAVKIEYWNDVDHDLEAVWEGFADAFIFYYVPETQTLRLFDTYKNKEERKDGMGYDPINKYYDNMSMDDVIQYMKRLDAKKELGTGPWDDQGHVIMDEKNKRQRSKTMREKRQKKQGEKIVEVQKETTVGDYILEKGDKVKVLYEYFFEDDELSNKESFKEAVLMWLDDRYGPESIKRMIQSDPAMGLEMSELDDYKDFYDDLKQELIDDIEQIPEEFFPLESSDLDTAWVESDDVYDLEYDDFTKEVRNMVIDKFLHF